MLTLKGLLPWRVARAGLKDSEKCPPDANSTKKERCPGARSCPMGTFASLIHSQVRVPAGQGQLRSVVCKAGAGLGPCWLGEMVWGKGAGVTVLSSFTVRVIRYTGEVDRRTLNTSKGSKIFVYKSD